MSNHLVNKLWIVSFPLCFTALIATSAFHLATANRVSVITKQAPAKTSTISSSPHTTTVSQLPALENPTSCHQIEQAIDDDIRTNKQRRIHLADIAKLCTCNEIKAFNSGHRSTMEIPENVVCDTETTITEKKKHKDYNDYDDCDDDDDDCDDD